MRFLTPILLLLVSTAAYCDEIKKPTIVLPINPVTVQPVDVTPVPTPVDPKDPVPVSTLRAGELYVIKDTAQLRVYDSRRGIVSITPVAGPVTFYFNKFSDAIDRDVEETRTYKEPWLYIVRAIKSGDVELIISPVGSVDDSTDIRQVLTVTVGPRPPPIPDIDPEPDPDVDPEPQPPTGIRVLMLYNEDANRQQLDVVNSTEIVQWMTENCAKGEDGRPEWRRWDRTSIERTGVDGETEVWKKLWNKVKPLITQNNMVFVATDTKVQFVPMTTVADTKAFLQRVKEGK